MSTSDLCPVYAPFFSVMGCTSAIVFTCIGASYGTAKSGVGISAMSVLRPDLMMKCVVPVIMAGIIAIYGLVVSVLISGSMQARMTLYQGFVQLGAGLAVGLAGLAAGFAVGIVGDAGVRGTAQQPRLFVGMILILIFAEVLGLYGLIVALIMNTSASNVDILAALLIAFSGTAVRAASDKSPQTANDSFHHIARFTQHDEQPVCSPTERPPLDPPSDFLSFEEWKEKQSAESQRQSLMDASSSTQPTEPDKASTDSVPAPSPTFTSPAHIRVPLTDRFNFASLDCSARVHTAHKGARSPHHILSSKRDKYLLTSCSDNPKYVVVELCDDIRIDTVQLANFEFFSGVFKDIRVSVAKTYTSENQKWTDAGSYAAKSIRGVQSFHPPTMLRDFYRFIRIDFDSHYSKEYYCPISLLRVYGLTQLEEWKWDIWEEEYRSQQKEPSSTLTSITDEVVEFASLAEAVVNGTSTDVHRPTETGHAQTSLPPSSRHMAGSLEHSVNSGAISMPLTHPPTSSVEVTHSSSSDITQRTQDSTSSLVEATSSTSTPAPLTTKHASRAEPSEQEITDLPPDNVTATSTSSSSVLTTLPTLLPRPSNALAVSSGESIYRHILNRLTSLEANSTLYARYVQEQTLAFRDRIQRMEEDIGRLEGLGKAQQQVFSRASEQLAREREMMHSSYKELLIRVNLLSEEITVEKRLGIVQLCLLLVVLVFMGLTRGSQGETFNESTSTAMTMLRRAGWRARSLNLSGDWTTTRSLVSPFIPNQSASPPKSVTAEETGPNDGLKALTPPPSEQTELHPRETVSTSYTEPSTPITIKAPALSASPSRSVRPQIRRSASLSHTRSGSPGTASPGIVFPRSARKSAQSAHIHRLRTIPRAHNVSNNEAVTPKTSTALTVLADSPTLPDASPLSAKTKVSFPYAQRLSSNAQRPVYLRARTSLRDYDSTEEEGWVDTDDEDSMLGPAGQDVGRSSSLSVPRLSHPPRKFKERTHGQDLLLSPIKDLHGLA